MAQTDDISTTNMPRRLLVLTFVLLLVRLGMIPFESNQAKASVDQIRWLTADQFDPENNSEGKLLLYEFGADWCEPCKRMESNVLANKQIASMITNRFVAIKVRDRLKEDGKNTQQISALEKKYHVFAFPTLVVVGSDGEAKATLVGSASALSTVHFLSRATRSEQK